MISTIKIDGDPVSVNQAYERGRGHHLFMTDMAHDWKETVFWSCKNQFKKPLIVDELRLDITLFFTNKRRRDIDNYLKLLLDGMTGVVFKDDSQIQEYTIRKQIAEKPGVFVTIFCITEK